MHLSFAAPQRPSGREAFIDYYHSENAQLKAYRAMITALDHGIGEVLQALDKRGMLARTVIVFHANTGGAVRHKFPIGDGDSDVNVASNGPYKDGRGSLHEGALRARAVVWRPGRAEPSPS